MDPFLCQGLDQPIVPLIHVGTPPPTDVAKVSEDAPAPHSPPNHGEHSPRSHLSEVSISPSLPNRPPPSFEQEFAASESPARGPQGQSFESVPCSSLEPGERDSPGRSTRPFTPSSSRSSSPSLEGSARKRPRVYDGGIEEAIERLRNTSNTTPRYPAVQDYEYPVAPVSTPDYEPIRFLEAFEAELIFTKGQNSFIPRGKVDDLINVDVVKRELDFLPEATIPHDSSTDDLARIICGEGSHKPVYRKIFALLTWKKNLGAIFQFLDEGVSDKDLPLKPYDTQGKPLEDSHFRVHRNNHPTQIVSCFGGWADRKIKEFLRCQWTVLSPFLVLGDATNIQHHEFHNDVILPFQPLYPETELVRMSGGFAVVNKVQVHPDHYRLEGQATNSEKKNLFAVKRPFHLDHMARKREIEMLKTFAPTKHRHLISLLGTYAYEGSVHLMFHWADADLDCYWGAFHACPTLNKRTVEWVARQCWGIADGLATIHGQGQTLVPPNGLDGRYYGRHGDLKPKNILWFKEHPNHDVDDMGTLVITDFGEAEMNTQDSRSGKPNNNLALTLTYCSPESQVPGGQISRSYDIWSLGCVYLEFLTWLLGGYKYVASFSDRRRYDYAHDSRIEVDWFFEFTPSGDGRPKAKVTDEVMDHINQLHSHPSCTEFIHEFLDLIQNGMLLVETEPSRSRLKIDQVCKSLGSMVDRMKEHDSYGLVPTPRTRHHSDRPLLNASHCSDSVAAQVQARRHDRPTQRPQGQNGPLVQGERLVFKAGRGVKRGLTFP